jgi:hypothetical protein
MIAGPLTTIHHATRKQLIGDSNKRARLYAWMALVLKSVQLNDIVEKQFKGHARLFGCRRFEYPEKTGCGMDTNSESSQFKHIIFNFGHRLHI